MQIIKRIIDFFKKGFGNSSRYGYGYYFSTKEETPPKITLNKANDKCKSKKQKK